MKFIMSLLLTVLPVMIASAQPDAAGNADRFPELAQLNGEEIKQRLAPAKLLRRLYSSKAAIDSENQCGKYAVVARDTDQELAALNQAYRNSRPLDYEDRANAIKRKNIQAIQDYKTCFSVKLQEFPALREEGITSYSAHRAKSSELQESIRQHTVLNEYIAALEQAYVDLTKNDFNVIVVVESVTSGEREQLVEIRRVGSLEWRAATKGMLLNGGDRIRTQSRARARVRFTPKSKADNSGPSIVNIGSSSEFELNGLRVKPRTSPRSLFNGAAELIRGTIRAFSTNWGSRSSFSIRTGTSLCGIRGTEVAVSYDPSTGVAKYTLEHGDAYAEANGRRVQMRPRTSVSIAAGVIGREEPLSDSDWREMVAATGPYLESTNPGAGTQVSASSGQAQSNTLSPATPSEEEILAAFGGFTGHAAQVASRSYVAALMDGDPSRMLSTSGGALREYHKQNFGELPLAELRGLTIVDVAANCSSCGDGDRCTTLVELDVYGQNSSAAHAVFTSTDRDSGRGLKVVSIEIATADKIAHFRRQGPSCR